jgi:hypothetical protein
MDAFLKTDHQNSTFRPGAITCVHGRTGIGKTHFVTRSLPGHVVVDHDVLKSRQGTLDFFDRLRNTRVPIVVDNWESVSDLIGVREIDGPVSHGPLVIIARLPVQLTPKTIMYPLTEMTPEQLIALAPPGHPRSHILAEKCRGDVRVYLQSLLFESDDSDIFETPREFVEKLLTDPNPVRFMGRTVHEHGYVWGMIQENYVDTRGLTLETCADLTDSLSLADMYDTKIYADGAWDTLMPYFIEAACIRPCAYINTRLGLKRLRAGSMWTKYQNMCMRAKKISGTRLSHDALMTLRVYIEHEQYDVLRDYAYLDASVIDVLNHIVIGRKMKTRSVERAKTYIRHNT